MPSKEYYKQCGVPNSVIAMPTVLQSTVQECELSKHGTYHKLIKHPGTGVLKLFFLTVSTSCNCSYALTRGARYKKDLLILQELKGIKSYQVFIC